MALEFSSLSVQRKKQFLYLILCSTLRIYIALPSQPIVSTEKLIREISTKCKTISSNRKWLSNPMSSFKTRSTLSDYQRFILLFKLLTVALWGDDKEAGYHQSSHILSAKPCGCCKKNIELFSFWLWDSILAHMKLQVDNEQRRRLSENQILLGLNAIYSKQSIWKIAEVLKVSSRRT